MSARGAIRYKISTIIIAAAGLYLLANGQVSLWDRDEPRYAQASRQMLRSGEWVVPHFLDKVRDAKPPLIYWCQALAMRLMGENAFAARFPSALAMTLMLIVVAIVTYRAIGPRRALWTCLVLASSGLIVVCAKSAITDSVLLLFVTIAQIAIYVIWRGSRSWSAILVLSSSIGLAGLTKGPVVLGIVASTLIALYVLDREQKRDATLSRLHAIRFLVALIIVGAICAPWIYLMEQRVPGYMSGAIREIFQRARAPQEGHRGWPGYYVVWIWITFFPWSLLLPATIVQAWRRRHIPVIRYCFAAVVGPWLMFEIIQTKLPHYLLPIFPPLALLTADMLVRAGRKLHQDITNPGFRWIVAIWGAGIVLVSLIPWLALKYFPNEIPPAAWWWMFVIPIFTFEWVREIWVYFRARRPLDAAAVMGIGVMIILAGIYTGYLRHAPYLDVSRRVADVLHANNAHDVMMIEYKEPSLAFYQGGTIRPQRDNLYLVHHAPDDWPNWLIIPRREWMAIPEALRDQFNLIDSIHGWAYADHGKIVDVLVLHRRDLSAGE